MNDGELRVLEYVKDQIAELREDFRTMRNEVMTSFMRHDESDNKRFSELFERIRPLEIGQAVQRHQDAEEQRGETREHTWRQVIIQSAFSLFAGICGAIATLLAAGKH